VPVADAQLAVHLLQVLRDVLEERGAPGDD
jgi:hypothetical protein